MTISIKPTASGSTIEQDGSTVVSIESDRSVDIDSGTLHVDATNNRVGIGTTSLDTKLDIVSGNDTETTDVLRVSANNKTARINIGYNFIDGDNDSGTGRLVFKTENSERMRIDSSGNVGIGTSSPGYKLDVVGAAGVRFTETDAQNGFEIAPASTVINTAYNRTTSTWLALRQRALQHEFYSNGTERMRIDSSGNVLVNSTSNTGLAAKLFVKGAYGIGTGYGTATSQYRVMYMDNGDSNLYFHNNSNYAILTSAGAWTNASDERLKNNIVDIKYGLDAVLNTQPRSYKMNDVEGDFVGFVAQELQTVIPEVVSGNPEKQLGVDYGSLVAVAFKAIQELKTENDTLKSQLSALETRIQALESN